MAHAELPLIVLLDLWCYQILQHPIVQSLRCMVLWPHPCCSLGSALMVEGGSEVRFIDGNGCKLSDSPVFSLYWSHRLNNNAFQCFYSINPQQQVKSQCFVMNHQHADLGKTAFLCGYAYHSDTATPMGHASKGHDFHCCLSFKTGTDLHSPLSASNPYQLVPNAVSCQHWCLPPGVPHLSC